MARMDPRTWLNEFRHDGLRIAELARGDLSAPVPTCPGWTLADLVTHTGYVHRWQTVTVRDAPSDRPDPSMWRHGPGADETLADWFASGVETAIAVMGAADPDAPRWTWAGPGTVRWYLRRITQETLVHRIDAELAAGVPVGAVEPSMAADGIEEMREVFHPTSDGDPVGGSGQTLHLHADDIDSRTGADWIVTLHADRITTERVTADLGGGPSDAALHGRAIDLLLMMWGRAPLGEVISTGDPTVHELFTAAARL
jgi:uncharacterized protein (TIGR03083 family)